MGSVARLRRGSKIFDLTTAPFSLGLDWSPFVIEESPQVAMSYDGYSAKRAGTRYDTITKSFLVRILGTSSEYIRASADELRNFIGETGGRQSAPLYFDWKPDNDVTYEPVAGHLGAYRTIKVLYGTIEPDSRYAVANLRSKGMMFRVSLLCSTKIEGNYSLLSQGKGGLFMDYIGQADGKPRGMMILEATTNKSTNPVFSHGTYDTGWTAQADLVVTKNTDPRFILFGKASAKITAIGATLRTFYQSLDFGNTNTHTLSFYAKKQDGSAVSNATIQPRYGANTYTDATYVSLGDGWYWVYKSFAGIAAATTTGVVVLQGVTVYIEGVQPEEKAYPTPLAWGGGLGCTWTGTAHASTTTRTAAYNRLATANNMDIGEWTLAIIWMPHLANTAYTADCEIFTDETTRAYWDQSENKIVFTDGTNTVTSDATTFSAFTPLVLHFVAESGSLKIYRNGVQIGTGSTYTPRSFGTYLYLGSTATPDTHLNGTFLGRSLYDQGMTAAEVLAQYTNISAAIAAHRRVDWIPTCWTKDGDNTVDNANSSTTDNYAVILDVPGSLPAKTQFWATITSDTAVHIGQTETDRFIDPVALQKDLSGTVVAGSLGGEVDTTNISTSQSVDSGWALTVNVGDFELINNRVFSIFARGKVDKDPLLLAIEVDGLGGPTYSKDNSFSGSDSNYYTYVVHSSLAGNITDDGLFSWSLITVNLAYTHGGSGTGILTVDYWHILPHPYIKVSQSSAFGTFFYNGERAVTASSSTRTLSDYLLTEGDRLELVPGKHNYWISVIGSDTSASVIADTLEYKEIYIIPRWAMA